jgi:hypothetical protein
LCWTQSSRCRNTLAFPSANVILFIISIAVLENVPPDAWLQKKPNHWSGRGSNSGHLLPAQPSTTTLDLKIPDFTLLSNFLPRRRQNGFLSLLLSLSLSSSLSLSLSLRDACICDRRVQGCHSSDRLRSSSSINDFSFLRCAHLSPLLV